jgi:hypothetical protein|tara:strand:+ start:6557 stop:7258 length:702 start_codon:yes stop_codon:yes gene_type:complete
MSCSCSCKCDGDEVITSTTSEDQRAVGTVVETENSDYQGNQSKFGPTKGAGRKLKKKPWWKVWGSETKNADCGCGSKAEQTKSVARGPQLTTAQTISDLAGWFNYPQREQFLFNSEMNESMAGSSNSVDHINPVEVQGSEDIMGAESVIFPQFTQNISGQGRTFANTIHPGMVIPNPDDYPTPRANNPWEPFVSIETYGDIKNVPMQPYPSAMDWARDPKNYRAYPSTDWYTP